MSDTDNKNISPEDKHAPAISQAVARYERLKDAAPLPTPQNLGEACEQGDLDAVKKFHENGANITAVNNYAVRMAAEIGHLEMVKYLHANGANITAKNNNAVCEAAENGYLDVVKYLHEHGADITGWCNAPGRMAAENGHLDVVKYLHENGANFMDVNNNDALFGAARNGHLDVVRYLHANGAKIIIITYMKNPMRYAAENGHLDVVEYLHANGVDVTEWDNEPVRYAAQNGHLDVVRYLHANGADLTTKYNEELFSAVRNGRLDMLQYLHENGAEITARNNYAVRLAAKIGHLEIVKYLHENGADITSRDNEAVRYAAENGHLDVVKYLHEHGGDLTARNNEAVRYAARNGHLDVVNYCIESGIPEEIFSVTKLQEIKNWKNWQKRHSDCPKGLVNHSPHYFRPKVFYPVRAVLEKEGYIGEIANQYAYEAAALFKTPDRFWRYVEKWADFSEKQSVHDAIQDIKIPQEGRFDLTAWGDACMKFGPKMTRLVKFADQFPAPMKDERGGWSYILTRNEIAKNVYKNAQAAPKLAELCFEATYHERGFEKALETLNTYTTLAARALEINIPAPNSQIPDIRIDGEAFDKPGYVLRKLESGDIKGLLLGAFTSCCQHIAGEGSECAEHGFLSPHGGFYVVEKQETGEITGQSWVWRGKNGELVLDSFERLKGHYTAQQVTTICAEIAHAASSAPKLETPVNGVYIGTGGATPSLTFNNAASPAQPLDYNAYRDSKEQYEIAAFEREIG